MAHNYNGTARKERSCQWSPEDLDKALNEAESRLQAAQWEWENELALKEDRIRELEQFLKLSHSAEKAAVKQVSQLQHESEEGIRNRIASLSSKIKAKDDKVDALRCGLSGVAREASSMRQELNDIRENVANRLHNVKGWHQQVLGGLTEALKGRDEEASNLRGRCSQLSHALRCKEEESVNMSQELEAERAVRKRIENQLQVERDDREQSLQRLRDEYESREESLRRKAQAWEEECLSQKQKMAEEVDSEIRKVQEMEEQKRHEAVETAKQKAREELSKSCADALEEAEQRFQQAQYDLESDAQLKDEKISELQKEIADLQAQKEFLEKSNHEERERIIKERQDHESAMEELRNEYDCALTRERERCSKLENDNERLGREVSEKDILLRQYSEKLAQSRQLLEQEVKFIRKVVFRARDELAKFLDQEKWRIHQTLRHACELARHKEALMAEDKGSIADLQHQLQDLEQVASQRSESLAKAERERDEQVERRRKAEREASTSMEKSRMTELAVQQRAPAMNIWFSRALDQLWASASEKTHGLNMRLQEAQKKLSSLREFVHLARQRKEEIVSAREETEHQKKQNDQLREVISQMRADMEELASRKKKEGDDSESLREQLAWANKKIKRQEKENSRLLELSNSLRSQLNRLMYVDTSDQQGIESGQNNNASHIPQETERALGPHHTGMQQPASSGRAPMIRRDNAGQVPRASNLETESQRHQAERLRRAHPVRQMERQTRQGRKLVRNFNIADDQDESAKLSITPGERPSPGGEQ